jgi:phosphoglycolate phosphatase-like HAD superfamily hydrolase
LLHAAQRLQVRSEACVMIGDTALDVEAGKRAGMLTVAIAHGMAARHDLQVSEPDHLIDSFDQLIPLLSR